MRKWLVGSTLLLLGLLAGLLYLIRSPADAATDPVQPVVPDEDTATNTDTTVVAPKVAAPPAEVVPDKPKKLDPRAKSSPTGSTSACPARSRARWRSATTARTVARTATRRSRSSTWRRSRTARSRST